MELASRLNAKKCPTFACPPPFCNRCNRLGLAHQERIGSSPQNTQRTETHTQAHTDVQPPILTYSGCPLAVSPGTPNPSPRTSLNDGAYATPRIREPAVSAPSPPLLPSSSAEVSSFSPGVRCVSGPLSEVHRGGARPAAVRLSWPGCRENESGRAKQVCVCVG